MTENKTTWIKAAARETVDGRALASFMYELIMNFPEEKEYLQLPGDFKKIPEELCKYLDGIDIEDLYYIRAASEGLNPDHIVTDIQRISGTETPAEGDKPAGIHEKVKVIVTHKPTREQRLAAWTSCLNYSMEQGAYPGETLFALIKANRFSITNNGRKISPALYASENDIENYLYPIRDELAKAAAAAAPTEKNIKALLINETVRKFNPYIHALKREPEFMNRPIEELANIILDYFKEKTNSRDTLIRTGKRFDILNWELLSQNFRLFFPCTKKDLKPFIEYVRKKISIGQYHYLPQGRDINKIITSIGAVEDEATQLDLFRTATIPIDKDFTLYVENYDKPLSPAARKTLDIFLIEYRRQGETGSVEMSLKDFMDYMGYTDKDYAKDVIQKILNGKELSNIAIGVREKGKPSGRIRVCGGTSAYIRGKIYWNFNVDFLPILQESFIAEMPREYLQTNDKRHPNSYYLFRAIWIDWRMNEGKRRRLSVKSLIDKCPPLKKKLDSKKKGEYIQDHFIEDLEAIENIFVDYVDERGNTIEDPRVLSFRDFYKSYIIVDQSDFPNHPNRLKHAATRRGQLEKAIDNARAKAIVKKENL